MNEEQCERSKETEKSDRLDQVNDSQQVSIYILPTECWSKIFSYLSFFDLITVYQVCDLWRNSIYWNKIKKLDFTSCTWGTASIDFYHVEILLKGCAKYLKKLGTYGSVLNYADKGNVIHLLATLLIAQTKDSNEETKQSKLKNIHLFDIKLDASIINSLQSISSSFTKVVLWPTEIDGCEECENALCTLFQQTERLEHLEVYLTPLFGKYLLVLPDSMHSIKIHDCNISESYLLTMLYRCHHLKILQIYNCDLSGQIFQFVAHYCQDLITLQLAGNLLNMTSYDMFGLLNLGNLRILMIGNNIYMSDEFLVLLSTGCQHIIALYLRACPNVTDIGLQAIAKLRHLEKLVLCEMHRITDTGLRNIRDLKEFYCTNCNAITNDGILMVFNNSPEMQVLNTEMSEHITLDIPQLFEQRALTIRK